jgi:hypothetical protein
MHQIKAKVFLQSTVLFVKYSRQFVTLSKILDLEVEFKLKSLERAIAAQTNIIHYIHERHVESIIGVNKVVRMQQHFFIEKIL